jgi:hypothetical protein
LQGEIEDILLHSPKRGKHLWIVVVLGIPADASPTLWGQFNALVEYTAHRAVEASRSNNRRNVSIEIAPVELAS